MVWCEMIRRPGMSSVIKNKGTKSLICGTKHFIFFPPQYTQGSQNGYWQDSERQAIYVQQNSVGSKMSCL